MQLKLNKNYFFDTWISFDREKKDTSVKKWGFGWALSCGGGMSHNNNSLKEKTSRLLSPSESKDTKYSFFYIIYLK